ncbi:MAG TPA: Wadjet anti-phage system protein JetA family protein [Candidatus Izemoplasmatales bacterium]|nr:Wadjet anti-phage system protein JetA family protein [Candidatus Izemoplasmatales bacterium]
MDVFNIIPSNFFGLLSGKNRQIYVNCLLELFRVYEQGSILGMNKDIAKQAIIDYLDINPLDEELEENDTSTEWTNRDRANQILRRLEKLAWIDVDVNNNYEEILNFRDYSITIIEALKDIANDAFYEDFEDDGHEFRGYIYTSYTLLNNDFGEYAMVLDQVYKNTLAFVREIRKLDSRLKYYIHTIVDNSEIKDLINLLVNYKTELMDKAYRRLKTSDNINKYRASIVKKLEAIQEDKFVMELLAKDHLVKSHNNHDVAMMKVNKKIDDIIDIYNSVSYIIDEIDNKNKVYVNTTIAKIKFLLSDDENVISKLSKILKFTAETIKDNRTKKALNTIQPLFTLSSYNQVSKASLYTPRGIYKRIGNQCLEDSHNDFDQSLKDAFYKEFETHYSEDIIQKYLSEYFRRNDVIRASDIINDDMSDEAILRLLYILVYAGDEMNYYIQPLNQKINNPKFTIDDFEIIKGAI